MHIAEVITAVDEKVDATRCGGAGNCHNNERCLTHDLWHALSSRIYDYLSGISLQDLVDRKGVQDVADSKSRKIELDRIIDRASGAAAGLNL